MRVTDDLVRTRIRSTRAVSITKGFGFTCRNCGILSGKRFVENHSVCKLPRVGLRARSGASVAVCRFLVQAIATSPRTGSSVSRLVGSNNEWGSPFHTRLSREAATFLPEALVRPLLLSLRGPSVDRALCIWASLFAASWSWPAT